MAKQLNEQKQAELVERLARELSDETKYFQGEEAARRVAVGLKCCLRAPLTAEEDALRAEIVSGWDAVNK